MTTLMCEVKGGSPVTKGSKGHFWRAENVLLFSGDSIIQMFISYLKVNMSNESTKLTFKSTSIHSYLPNLSTK